MSKVEALRCALAARGIEWPAVVEWHRTIESTNDRLKSLAREGAAEWTVVMADQQTRGRGREGRTWVSPPGGLYLSVLLRGRFARLGLVPLAAGVAVAEAAEEHGVRVVLKWPNDVLVEESSRAGGSSLRKLAGILAEGASGAPGTEWVVLGIGVNVTAPDTAPVSEGAVEMAWVDEAAPGVNVVTVAAAVLARLRVWYDALCAGSSSIVPAWRGRAIAWWGETVEVIAGTTALRGRLLDVDAEGALLISTEAGGVARLFSGEVGRVRRRD